MPTPRLVPPTRIQQQAPSPLRSHVTTTTGQILFICSPLLLSLFGKFSLNYQWDFSIEAVLENEFNLVDQEIDQTGKTKARVLYRVQSSGVIVYDNHVDVLPGRASSFGPPVLGVNDFVGTIVEKFAEILKELALYEDRKIALGKWKLYE